MADAEQIAALLDDRLDAKQRADIVARLATSEAAFESFVDAAAILAEGTTSSSKTIAIRPRRTAMMVLAAAAVIAAILAPAVLFRSRATSDRPERFAALLASQSQLAADWNGAPWTTTRGAAEPLTDSARGVRLGARLTDLALEVRGQDARGPRTARDIAALLDAVPGSAPVARVFRQIANPVSGAAERDSLLDLGEPLVATIAGRDLVDLGAWMEAARIAASRRDSAFFHSASSRAIMTRLPASLAITFRDPNDWNDLQTQLATRLAAMGS
jgi:hypothetical protein